jgi:hypothetical protein
VKGSGAFKQEGSTYINIIISLRGSLVRWIVEQRVYSVLQATHNESVQDGELHTSSDGDEVGRQTHCGFFEVFATTVWTLCLEEV